MKKIAITIWELQYKVWCLMIDHGNHKTRTVLSPLVVCIHSICSPNRVFLIDFVFSEEQDFQFDSQNIYSEMQNEDYTLANVSGYK